MWMKRANFLVNNSHGSCQIMHVSVVEFEAYISQEWFRKSMPIEKFSTIASVTVLADLSGIATNSTPLVSRSSATRIYRLPLALGELPIGLIRSIETFCRA